MVIELQIVWKDYIIHSPTNVDCLASRFAWIWIDRNLHISHIISTCPTYSTALYSCLRFGNKWQNVLTLKVSPCIWPRNIIELLQHLPMPLLYITALILVFLVQYLFSSSQKYFVILCIVLFYQTFRCPQKLHDLNI